MLRTTRDTGDLDIVCACCGFCLAQINGLSSVHWWP